MISEFHIPVLLNTAVDLLINKEIREHTLVDGTTGGGGYSELICEKYLERGQLVCFDKDSEALEFARKRLIQFTDKIIFLQGNFAEIGNHLQEKGINKITGIVLDLGLSNYQLTSEDGFSYLRNTPLDMRADKSDSLTASDVLRDYDVNELIRIFREYGEVGQAVKLSDAIVNKRNSKNIETTFDLVKIIEDSFNIPSVVRNKFLSKVFQALRIEVNNELENLTKVLSETYEILGEGGRMVIVSYHSLEDRIVKNFFKEKSFSPSESKYKTEVKEKIKKFKLLNKKAIIPDEVEKRRNPKSRSAKLRAAEIVYK